MELSPELVFLNAVSSSVIGGRVLWKWWKKRNHKLQTFCILSSRKSGISTSLKSLELFSRFTVVDVKDNVLESITDKERREHLLKLLDENHQSFALEAYPLVDEYIQKCRKTFPRKPVVLFTSDESLIQYLNIPKEQVACLLPSLSMYQRFLEQMDAGDTSVLTESRERLIQTKYAKFIYRNFQHLNSTMERILTKND